ncbi:MAG: hypothetical protein IZT55_02705 [Anaerolineae bacterium]|nr:hypothetical protein [Anaerolineae bacterium]
MKIVRNEKLISRNAQIGKITTILSLAVLGGGMYLTFTRPELANYALGALLAGFLLSQVGIYFSNRWGRRPRPDEILDTALKGFGDNYHLYHYITRVSHLLVGPAGVWILIPKHQSGTIGYSKNRWRKTGVGIFGAYLNIFAQEGLGRPDIEIKSEIDSLNRYFVNKMPDQEIPKVQAALLFSHPKVNILVENAPSPTLLPKQLKDHLRKEAKTKPISSEMLKTIQLLFEE